MRTPYDRPTFTNPPPENPNWLSRFLYSPTRSIVSNAGKVLSSVFRSDSSSSSEDGSDDDEDDGDYVSSQEDDGLKKVIALHVIIFFCLLVIIMLEIDKFFFWDI